jgi:hypothetical protein
MHFGLIYIPMIVLGLAAMIWGLPASHRLARPWDIAAALAVLAGLIAAIMGTLLTLVPNFFR